MGFSPVLWGLRAIGTALGESVPATAALSDGDDRPPVLFIADTALAAAENALLASRIAHEDAAFRAILAYVGPTAQAGATRLPERPAELRQWLSLNKPELAVVNGNPFRAVAVSELDAALVPIVLLSSGLAPPARRFRRFLPGTARGLIGRFRRVLSSDPEATRQLRRLGVEPSAILRVGQLILPPPIARYRGSEREALRSGLGARPVWCVCDLPDAEIPLVLDAVDQALRSLHRLLLVILPQNPNKIDTLLAALSERGHEALVRSAGDDPDGETQVYIADIHEEHGLWFSIAEATYLGGTLLGTGPIRHPMEPAGLGSAVILGPQRGQFGPTIDAMLGTHAAMQVRDSGELARALELLASPEGLAEQTGQAWRLLSNWAEIADLLANEIQAKPP